MKKFKLNLDEIKVESFQTSINSKRSGTVFANAWTDLDYPTCAWDCNTEENTCGLCGQTAETCPSLPAILCCPNTAGMECSAYCPPTGVEITCHVPGSVCTVDYCG